MQVKFTDFTKCWWSFPRPGVQHRCFQGAEHTTIIWDLLYPGHEEVEESYEFENIIHVLKGHLTVTVDGEAVDMPEKAVILLKPGAVFSVANAADGISEYIQISGVKRPELEATEVMPGFTSPISNKVVF